MQPPLTSKGRCTDLMAGSCDALLEAGMLAPRKKGISDNCIRETVDAHDQKGWNYAWLMPIAGRLLWADHREPAKRVTSKEGKPDANWKTYNSWSWARHSAVVDHHPENLVEEHVRYYLDENTRLIDLRYYMQLPSGFVYVTEPIREWYVAERDWFKKWGLCSGDTYMESDLKNIDQMMADNYSLKGLAPWIPAKKIMNSMIPAPRVALSVLAETLKKEKIPHKPRNQSRSHKSPSSSPSKTVQRRLRKASSR